MTSSTQSVTIYFVTLGILWFSEQEVLVPLEEKRPKNQRELCDILKTLHPLGKTISNIDRAYLDHALRMFYSSRKSDLFIPFYPALQFLGFWQRHTDQKILALFIDTNFYFVPESFGFYTPVFDKETVSSQLALGPSRMSANWEEAMSNWPKEKE